MREKESQRIDDEIDGIIWLAMRNLRDPEEDIDFRLDAGPPPKPGGVVITIVKIPLEKIVEFFKRLFRR